tara:strand:+ start:19276 stop:19650 length:375 start_codon:yes stop_codon:yes gene_type:complete
MSLNFYQTCPTIDQGIAECKDIIENYLDDMVNDINPEFYSDEKGKNKNNVVESFKDMIYNDIEHIFESVRETNVQMREVADEQIRNLEYEVEEMSSELEDLKIQYEQAEKQILNLEIDRENACD